MVSVIAVLNNHQNYSTWTAVLLFLQHRKIFLISYDFVTKEVWNEFRRKKICMHHMYTTGNRQSFYSFRAEVHNKKITDDLLTAKEEILVDSDPVNLSSHERKQHWNMLKILTVHIIFFLEYLTRYCMYILPIVKQCFYHTWTNFDEKPISELL
jgi:hypothetical protein